MSSCEIYNKREKSYYDKQHTLVLAAGRPNSNFLFLRRGLRLPPVFLRLCQWSREIPVEWIKRYYNNAISKVRIREFGIESMIENASREH